MVVVASDDARPALDDMSKMAYHKVTVTVTDVDEDGSVSLSTLQPQVRVDLTATLTDQDARSGARPISDAKWKWEQGPAMNGPWSLISGAGAGDMDATADTKASDGYQPAADTVGKYLRATVTYTDKHGDDKTAMAVSAHAVRAVPDGGNSAPEFPTAADGTVRTVKENSPPGTTVGKPVTAGDAGDILTYTMADTSQSFTIDRATGQITVGPRTMLDREAAGFEGAHVVMVRATDPYGDPNNVDAVNDLNSVEVTVTITVDNVNEAPMITAGPTKDSKAEDFDSDVDAGGRQLVVDTYEAADGDDVADVVATLDWSLTGPDAADFKIEKDTDIADTADAKLSFKKAPNFEMPTDANMDNMYMVTVVATDAKKLTAMRDVVITVTNANDLGKITLSSVQPKVGIDFTATLSDPDGGVKDVKWQWASADILDAGDCPDRDADTWTDIAKAKSDTYTPVDANVGDAVADCLLATATYTDSDWFRQDCHGGVGQCRGSGLGEPCP